MTQPVISKACQRIAPWLSAFMDGQLEPAQAADVRDHLTRCLRCQAEVQTLDVVGQQLATMKTPTPGAGATAGLLAGLRSLPTWLVRLAVVRRWVMASGGAALAMASVLLLLRWAGPLPATVIAQGIQQSTQQLPAGTTLLARAGETVTLTLPNQGGMLRLYGPGGLVVRHAARGYLQQDQRLLAELPSGTLEVKMDAHAPAHDIRLSTPQAHVRLRGTWILVSASPSITQVTVLEGEARLQSVASATTPQAMRLIQGQQATVQAGWVTVAQIPLEDWLTRKGLAEHPSEETATLASPTQAPAPLWHEESKSPTP